MRAFTRRIAYSAATLTAGVALAGCTVQVPAAAPPQSAATSSTASSSTQSSSAGAPADPPPSSGRTGAGSSGNRCTAKNLKGTFTKHPATRRQHEPGIYGAEISLQNVGKTPCTIFGYAGLAQDGMHGPLDTFVKRVEDPGAPQQVTLEPFNRADANLTFVGGSQGNSAKCIPPPARFEVIAPDDTQQIPIDTPADPQLINCDSGHFDLGPFYYTPND